MPHSSRLPCPRGSQLTIVVDGSPVIAYGGETVATALLVHGVAAFHRAPDSSPRLPFCNMGTCLECQVSVEDQPLQRACLIPVRAGMRVNTVED
ncbi:MAG TPA: (2Fe-2S)-binding protein [Nocardioides sp.]|uniref:(2Fe-2S)-binding protein n=1 Tax=Nocardioides sp. TaxID=35761 RepID=UPI002C330002|nr:(2Fe-2S)-binding protein [Nocardioides sp.]HQR25523.1 (2Fe-2S)-binding protein [Nocardioides sp.]